MRKRSFSLPPVGETIHVTSWPISNPSLVTDYGYYNVSWVPKEGVIVDEPRRRYLVVPGGKRVQAMKVCTHSTSIVTCDASNKVIRTSATHMASTSPLAIATYEVDGGADQPYWSGVTACLSSLAEVSDDYYTHWQLCKPKLAGRASMFVFLAELRDIKRMFDVIPRTHLRSSGGKYILQTWREALRFANGQHLSYFFGWSPFVRDVQNVFRALSDWRARLRKFIKSSNSFQMRRRRDTYEVSKTLTKNVSIYRREHVVTGVVNTASNFQFIYDVPKYSDTELNVRAMLDIVGFNPSLESFWQLVPWSFVADWFYNVGGLLGTVESDWVEPWINYIQSCHSVRARLSCRSTIYTTYGAVMHFCTSSLNSYTRTLGMPRFNGNTEALDADKIRLLASLVAGLIL